MKILLLLSLLLYTLQANERIVALSPAIGEILYALDSYDDVVAVSSFSTFPRKSINKPKIGGYFEPNLEKILSLKPTLVIGASHNTKILKKLEHFHIKTLQLRFFKIEDIKTSILKMGEVIHKNAKAKEVLNEIELTISQTRQKPRLKKVLVVFGGKEEISKSNYVAGHDSFYEEILTICGVKNAYNHTYLAQPVLDYESLLRLNPDDVIILYSKQTDNISKKDLLQTWKRLPIKASKTNNIHILENDYLFIASQRISLSIKDICEVLDD